MSLFNDSYTISKKQWAIIAAVAAVILFIIIKANTPHEAAPTGFVELGTTYAEAKPVIQAAFPGAEFVINDEMTGVSHGAIKVTVNDYEGIKGLLLLSESELCEWLVNGKIDDGFTLSAIALLSAKKAEKAI